MAYSIGIVCSRGVGPERGGRDRNEDNFLICRDGRITFREADGERVARGHGEGVLLAVADGMGGHEDGDIASTTAARVLAKLYRPGLPRDPMRALRRYVLDSHKRLYWKARDKGPVTMGTTLTGAWLLGAKAAWVHVGDSRLYLLRRGRLVRLTADHTLGEFARRDGRPQPPQGEHLAQTFIYGSRGIGDNTALRIEPGLDSGVEPLEVGDRLLLCTDGLSGAVDDVSIAHVLDNTPDPQAAAVAAMERAIARGSTDNITVMVVRVDEIPEQAHDAEVWEDDDERTLTF